MLDCKAIAVMAHASATTMQIVSPLSATKAPAGAVDAPPPAAAAPATWRTARADDDCYARCLRRNYFPLLVARPRAVLLAWLLIFVVSAVFGLGLGGASAGFLGSTRSNLDLPKGTPSGDAVLAFKALYPTVSSWAPAVIVLQVARGGAAGGVMASAEARAASAAIDAFASGYSGGSVVSYTKGFFQLSGIPGLAQLALQSVSPDNLTATIDVGFKQTTTLNDINHFIDELIPFVEEQSTQTLKAATTGLFPLFRQMSIATEKSFSTIDSIVIPLAMLILGVRVQSYRHIGIALINLLLAVLLSFAILTPVAAGFDVNPFAPSIMLSLGVAVCFDYSLFLITRFREERLALFKSREEAVFEMMLTAGHVVLLSGGTLMATFLILVFFDQNFLQSVGASCSVTTAATIIVNLSVTPAMLLAFDCMSLFDPIPSRASFCCRIPAADPAETARAAKAAADAAAEVSGEAAAALRAREQVARAARGSAVGAARRAFWFRVSWEATSASGRWLSMAFAALLTIPFLITVLGLMPTSDAYLVYLQDSSTLNALTAMKKSFPEGRLDPYNIVVSTGVPGGVLTAPYFAAENALVRDVLAKVPSFVAPSSFSCVSFFEGRDVPFATAMQVSAARELS